MDMDRDFRDARAAQIRAAMKAAAPRLRAEFWARKEQDRRDGERFTTTETSQ